MRGARRAALLGLLGVRDHAAPCGAPMRGGGSDWTTGRWAEAAGASHRRSAARWVRGSLGADASGAGQAGGNAVRAMP